MSKTIRVGDRIRWMSTIYTVMEIDLSKPPTQLFGMSLEKQVLFQYDEDGQIKEIWSSSYDDINSLLMKGIIEIINPRFDPLQDIKKFKFL